MFKGLWASLVVETKVEPTEEHAKLLTTYWAREGPHTYVYRRGDYRVTLLYIIINEKLTGGSVLAAVL